MDSWYARWMACMVPSWQRGPYDPSKLDRRQKVSILKYGKLVSVIHNYKSQITVIKYNKNSPIVYGVNVTNSLSYGVNYNNSYKFDNYNLNYHGISKMTSLSHPK